MNASPPLARCAAASTWPGSRVAPPSELEEERLRIGGKEAARNAVQHVLNASEIRIVLEEMLRKLLRLSVCDDGQGFDPEEEGLPPSGSLGLEEYAGERSAQIHGCLHYNPAPSEGTEGGSFAVPVPLKRRRTVTE